MVAQYIEIDVTPELLTWGRESIGYTIEDIADKINVSKERIFRWEKGEDKISYSKLKKLAKIYHRPTVLFFLEEPPEEPPLPKDFRMVDPKNPPKLKPETLLAVRSAWQHQINYKELIDNEELENQIRLPTITLKQDPEETGIIIREQLNISEKTQEEWKSDAIAYNEWKKIIESYGILVMQNTWDMSDGRAFSISDGLVPIIVINSKDVSYNARIFSLMHELAHIQLNISGICNPGYLESSMDPGRAQNRLLIVERYCNHFAGSILVPMKYLLASRRVKTSAGPQEWGDDRLKRIATDFHVSKEVVLRRLLIGNKTTKKHYLDSRKRWRSRKQATGGGGPRDYAKECINKNGEKFTDLVISSYENNEIPLSDVSDYLSVKLTYFSRIEKLVHGEK